MQLGRPPICAAPTSTTYSLGIQRQLGSAFSLEIDYQGSTGHKLGLFIDRTSQSYRGQSHQARVAILTSTSRPSDPFSARLGPAWA